MNLAEIREKAVRASVSARVDEVQELAEIVIRLVDEVGERLDKIEDQLTSPRQGILPLVECERS